MRASLSRLSALLLAAALAGCNAMPTAEPALPVVPKAFRHAPSTDVPAPAGADAWWQAFADPVLHDLAVRAGASNTTVRQAVARLARARAASRAASAEQRPQAALNAGASRQGGPLINAAGDAGTLVTTAAGISWEADLSGRLSGAARAAEAEAASGEALLNATRLAVQADVVGTYLALRALDAEHRVVLDMAAVQRDTLELLEGRRRAGLAAEQEARAARAAVLALEAEAQALLRSRTAHEHALAFLVAEAPSRFSVAPHDVHVPLPTIPAGIPAIVLARRPDVAAAQRAVVAAQARLGVAQGAWLPTLNLTASGGAASVRLGELLASSARAWALGALLAVPLFDGGRREAAMDAARADLEAAAAAHAERILLALREVEDELAALERLRAQASIVDEAARSSARVADLARSRRDRGLASGIEVLEARRRELADRRTALATRALQEQTTVRLVHALGGGWGSGPSTAMRAAVD